MDYKHHTSDTSVDALSAGAPARDLERYLPEISDQFATHEEALEFLRILWDIMCAFVDLGWGVDSITLAFPELGEMASDTREGS